MWFGPLSLQRTDTHLPCQKTVAVVLKGSVSEAYVKLDALNNSWFAVLSFGPSYHRTSSRVNVGCLSASRADVEPSIVRTIAAISDRPFPVFISQCVELVRRCHLEEGQEGL